MTHVGRQERQLRLHFNARSIPSKQCVNGEAVTKVMDPWQPTVRLLDLCHLEKQSYIPPQRIRRVSAPAFIANPNERCI
jgi:hypothetical protein